MREKGASKKLSVKESSFFNFKFNFGRRFRNFCSNTTLHGWSYLIEYPLKSWQTFLWSLVLLSVHAIVISFIFITLKQYLKSTTRTTIETTTTSLKEIQFPAITVCNVNQFEASFMEDVGIYNNISLMRAVFSEYINGPGNGDESTAKNNTLLRELLSQIDWIGERDLEYNSSFSEYSHQPCENMVMAVGFMGEKATWQDLGQGLVGALTVGTDFGFCCEIIPQVALTDKWEKVDRIPKGSKNGESNGLTALFDIENFNFAYHRLDSPGAGVKAVVHDPQTKPFFEHESFLLQPGSRTQINLVPFLTVTSDDAILDLSAEQRQCYADKEVTLKYFEDGVIKTGGGYFHYDLTNCVFNFAMHRILSECGCQPHFLPRKGHANSSLQNHQKQRRRPFCTGSKISCMDGVLGNVGGSEDQTYVVVDDRFDELTADSPRCLPSCRYQQNYAQLSTIPYPQKNLHFALQEQFCHLAQKLHSSSCAPRKGKRKFLDFYHPGLCEMIAARNEFFFDCGDWPAPYLDVYGSKDIHRSLANVVDGEHDFLLAMQTYAEENLVSVVMAIKSPYIQTISRDVDITFTSFVGSMGGLLGLCIGFSIISFIELIYHCLLNGR